MSRLTPPRLTLPSLALPSLVLPRLRAAPALLLPLALLAGCGGIEGQVRKGLVNAGLSDAMAGCMARPMAKDLSMNQLMKLRSLGSVGRMDVRNTSYNELLRKVRALGDADILRVTSAAALSCAFGI